MVTAGLNTKLLTWYIGGIGNGGVKNPISPSVWDVASQQPEILTNTAATSTDDSESGGIYFSDVNGS